MRRARSYEDWAADGALVLAGGAAILLQLTDPVLARSVAAHSRFATDPVGRLRGTLAYVYAVALGTDARRASAGTRVDRAHRGVPGADDPERQAWVAATLYWAGTTAHEALYGPLDPALADEILRRSALLGTTLRMPPGLWAADRAAFAAWWAERIRTAEVGADARRVAHQLLRPSTGPAWLRAAMPLGRLLTAGLLPPEIRAAYGVTWTPRLARRYRRTLRVLAAVWRAAPRRIRELPARRLAHG